MERPKATSVSPLDPSEFRKVVDAVYEEHASGNSEQTRHATLHLLFPEEYVGITGREHREAPVRRFAREAGVVSTEDEDKALHDIREYLRAKHDRDDLEFYDDDIRPLWKPPSRSEQRRRYVQEASSEHTNVSPETEDVQPALSELDALAATTHLDIAFLQEIDELLSEKRQIIFEGPPGSGKTFVVQHFATWFVGERLDGPPIDRVEIVQFHQSYGYEDFVQGIRPETRAEGQLTYAVRDGVFLDMCRRAQSRPDEIFVLLIDEINRGNISRIFGELLLLLEYRGQRARLPYATGDDPYLRIPENLYIIGTMNSADRSLAQVDYALRRRFYFVRFMPVENGDAPVLRGWLSHQILDQSLKQDILTRFVDLNTKVSELLSPDIQIGHSYLMNANVGQPGGIDRIWNRAIRPLLEEYFHHHRNRQDILADLRSVMLKSSLPPRTDDDQRAVDGLEHADEA